MNNTQRGILNLIKSALTGEPLHLPEGFDIAEAYKEIRRHQIVPIAYTGAVYCGVPKDDPVMQQMFQIYLQQMLRSESQMAAVQRIFAAFDENGIDYMPLKGSVLKGLYPKPELRLMGDADILIRQGQYPQISGIMEELGFEFKIESDHELIWQNNALCAELHKHLIPSYNKDYYAYYSDGWQLAAPETGTRHGFRTPEDEFVYLFTHFAKHYRDGGIGCRQTLDLYVYRSKHPDMDEQYIAEVLTKLQLLDFYRNMLHTLDVWFSSGIPDDRSEIITEYIFASGNWGTAQNHLMAGIIKSQQTEGTGNYGRGHDLLRKTFPGYQIMKTVYPSLEGKPYLTPVYWGVRIARTLLFRRDHLNKKMETYKASTDENIATFQDSLDYVGLRFNFKK